MVGLGLYDPTPHPLTPPIQGHMVLSSPGIPAYLSVISPVFKFTLPQLAV